MRLKVVNERTEIPKVNPEERMVHLSFRVSNVDILNLMQRCPRLRMIQVPPAYHKTLSNALQVFLEMQGIELLEGDSWGDRTCLDEYLTVDDITIEKIRAMTTNGVNIDDVATQIQEKTKISPDLIKYIAKTEMAV